MIKVEGGNDTPIIRPPGPPVAEISEARSESSSENPALRRYWRTGYTVVLPAYRPLLTRAGKSTQFREFPYTAPSLEWLPLGFWQKEKVEVAHESL
jgi:hypothetical protein